MPITSGGRSRAVVADGASSEQDLVRRAREGDEDAFRILFDRHAGMLTHRIRASLPRQMARKVSVADVLQETRIVAYQRRSAFDTKRGPFRNWLLGIADNKVREALRKNAGPAVKSGRREITRADRGDTANLPGPGGPSPSEAAMAAEQEELIRSAVSDLPDDYREILRLTREEGLTPREVAERMGRSREAVRKLYGRAVTKLKQSLHRREQGHDRR